MCVVFRVAAESEESSEQHEVMELRKDWEILMLELGTQALNNDDNSQSGKNQKKKKKS